MGFHYFLVAAILIVFCNSSLACEGCGCRGGPGYRGQDGRCVGWKDLAKKCGSPPSSRCSAEGPNAASGDGDKSKSDK
jgi:hypothetical protein